MIRLRLAFAIISHSPEIMDWVYWYPNEWFRSPMDSLRSPCQLPHVQPRRYLYMTWVTMGGFSFYAAFFLPPLYAGSLIGYLLILFPFYFTMRSLKKWFCNLGHGMLSWESIFGNTQKVIGAVNLSAHHVREPSVVEFPGKNGSHLRRRVTNSSAVTKLV